MAATVNKDMIIYNTMAQTAYLERLQDNLAVFNAASNGAFIYRSEAIAGDFNKEAFYKVGGSIEYRDVNSNAKTTVKKISMGEAVGVKCPYKYGPYASTEEAFKRRARTVEEFAMIVGQDMADALMVGRLQYSMDALAAAIGGNPPMVSTADIATHGRKTLTKAKRKMGDKFDRIALWVMNSDDYFDIVDEAITPATQIYGEGDIVIYGGLPGTLGRPVLVTDQCKTNQAFGLQAGAIQVIESQAPGFRAYDINDEENLGVGIRGEGVFNIEMLGYSYKGAENPNLETIGKVESWEKHATSNKMTAGVLLDLTPTAGGNGGLGD